MKIVKRSKGGGKFRTLYIPSRKESKFLYFIKGELEWIYAQGGVPSCVHGFWYGRSPRTNAEAHLSKRYTLSLDLKDFFDSITEKNLVQVLDYQIPHNFIPFITVDGRVRQGLCTSPILSNLYLKQFDCTISRYSEKAGVVYTRYADDITISADDINRLFRVERVILKNLYGFGLEVNWQKRKIQDASKGRRIITGLSVADDVRLPKNKRKRARAALHQNKMDTYNGMTRWYESVPPLIEVETVLSFNGIRLFKAKLGPHECNARNPKRAINKVLQKTTEYLRRKWK